MIFTKKELAAFKGVHPRTFSDYLKESKFKKSSIGRFYSETEARKIGELLDFKLPEINGKKVS